MNKLIIDGTDYELEEAGVGSNLLQPFIIFKGKNFVGKAIPNQPKQKDWEILEAWNAECHHPYIEKNCKPNGCKIVSVKRLSDNLIFSIDDKFTADAGQELTIKGFEVEGGIMKVFSKEHGYWHLSDIKKAEPKALNWVVFKKYGFGFPIWEVIEYKGELGYNWDDSVFVSGDKSEAEQYAAKNKRCLSFADVVNVMTQSGNEHFPFFPQLYDLAKERVDGK